MLDQGPILHSRMPGATQGRCGTKNGLKLVARSEHTWSERHAELVHGYDKIKSADGAAVLSIDIGDTGLKYFWKFWPVVGMRLRGIACHSDHADGTSEGLQNLGLHGRETGTLGLRMEPSVARSAAYLHHREARTSAKYMWRNDASNPQARYAMETAVEVSIRL